MKKIISLLLSALLALTVLSPLQLTALADGDAVYLTLGVPQEVSCASFGTEFRFVPEENGSYKFYSAGEVDTYGTLYTAAGDELASDDSNGERFNFALTCDLTAGEEYVLRSALYDANGSDIYRIAVKKDLAITAIDAQQSEPIEIVDGVFGYHTYDASGNETGFTWALALYQPGTELTVTYADGSVNTFCGNELGLYVAADGDYLDISNTSFGTSAIDISEWTAGNTYAREYYLWDYPDAVFTLNFKVVENPVERFELIPATPFVFYENTRGWWDTDDDDNDYYYYNEYGPANYDTQIVVYYTDNTSDTYTYGNNDDADKDGFFNADGEELMNLDIHGNETTDLDTEDSQMYSHWAVGGDNYFTVRYMGRTCRVGVNSIKVVYSKAALFAV